MPKSHTGIHHHATRPLSHVSQPLYPSGSVRLRRWHGLGDVRAYAPPAGWMATAELIDSHPISGEPFVQAQWWIIETKK